MLGLAAVTTSCAIEIREEVFASGEGLDPRATGRRLAAVIPTASHTMRIPENVNAKIGPS